MGQEFRRVKDLETYGILIEAYLIPSVLVQTLPVLIPRIEISFLFENSGETG